MSHSSLRDRVTVGLSFWILVAALVSSAGPAAAQGTPCFITGPNTACKSVQLCGPGPSDLYSYRWTGPNGFESTLPCIIAEDTGLYTLVVTANATGTPSPPCTHFFERTKGGIPCGITGNRPICPGETVELCGPLAGTAWSWTGPSGYTATSRCITVGTTGLYELTVIDAFGCESVCREEVVLSSDCGGPGEGFDCPRTPGFWSQQCAARGNGSQKFSQSEMTSITGCIDDMSALFDWGTSDLSRFCGNIDPMRPMDVRKQARRHFAALLANVCAGGSSTSNGERVGLDPNTRVFCGRSETTISELIANTDDALVRLQTADLSLARVRSAYSEIIACLDAINNGRGLSLDCEDDSEIDKALAPSQVELGRAYPNPFQSTTRLAFAVSSDGADVQIAVYDVAGRLVRSLAAGSMEAGRHEVGWDGADASGTRVQAGIYFIRGFAGANRIGTQVLLMK